MTDPIDDAERTRDELLQEVRTLRARVAELEAPLRERARQERLMHLMVAIGKRVHELPGLRAVFASMEADEVIFVGDETQSDRAHPLLEALSHDLDPTSQTLLRGEVRSSTKGLKSYARIGARGLPAPSSIPVDD